VFVLQGKEVSSGEITFEGTVHERNRTTRNFPPIFYLVTPTGRIRGEDWDLIFRRFVEIVKPWIGARSAILYLDNLGSHITSNSLSTSLDNDITLLFLPPNTTHLLQPLDDLAFSTFKTSLKSSMRHYMCSDGFSVESFTQVMLQLSYETMIHGLTREIVQKSFYNTGIFPFNSDKIKDKAEKFLGM
jgi:hypothetical protein